MSIGLDILALTSLATEFQEEEEEQPPVRGSTDVQIREPGRGGPVYHYVSRRPGRVAPAWLLRRRGPRLVSG
jgi:hypothetical protein